jgi:hypothetical protein
VDGRRHGVRQFQRTLQQALACDFEKRFVDAHARAFAARQDKRGDFLHRVHAL